VAVGRAKDTLDAVTFTADIRLNVETELLSLTQLTVFGWSDTLQDELGRDDVPNLVRPKRTC